MGRIRFLRRQAVECLLLIVLVVGAALACKRQSAEEKAAAAATQQGEALRGEVQKRLQTIAGLGSAVKQQPEVAGDKPLGKSLGLGTYAILGEAWLSDPGRSAESGELDLGHTVLSLCKGALADTPIKADNVRWLEDCAKLQHAAVVRTRKLVLPKVDAARKEFDPGELRADVFVFDLASGALVASYLVIVSNDSKLEQEGQGHSAEDWTRMAMANLKVNAESKIERLLNGS